MRGGIERHVFTFVYNRSAGVFIFRHGYSAYPDMVQKTITSKMDLSFVDVSFIVFSTSIHTGRFV